MPAQISNPDDSYTIKVAMVRTQARVGQWLTDNWECLLLPAEASDPDQATTCATLQLLLHRDERTAYRMNLSSREPKLFIVCDLDDEQEDELMHPLRISASQDLAAAYMDGGEEDVFSAPMPAAVQCWIEAFMSRHGEDTSDTGKRRRRGKGEKHKGAKDAQPETTPHSQENLS
ncbi:DUF3305 domain-containing protein [Aestuariirhabdus sp. Z084]|uniref:DUF3305 domain-containing protein n=1 Tax=Aestuariirhabdus haliotis TaxID=2918751 RepID=UPI00201B3EB8|nr:DUF3305 domain-containing protein [Aestuariirhabdus haliotis]MCL6416258.1 DUF3305 domain-containing protein [Aestuariirhabdus haliotis]MCL6420282.1 DUF3305 domain-containing protein [Aestuariirhabdus haliotis]